MSVRVRPRAPSDPDRQRQLPRLIRRRPCRKVSSPSGNPATGPGSETLVAPYGMPADLCRRRPTLAAVAGLGAAGAAGVQSAFRLRVEISGIPASCMNDCAPSGGRQVNPRAPAPWRAQGSASCGCFSPVGRQQDRNFFVSCARLPGYFFATEQRSSRSRKRDSRNVIGPVRPESRPFPAWPG